MASSPQKFLQITGLNRFIGKEDNNKDESDTNSQNQEPVEESTSARLDINDIYSDANKEEEEARQKRSASIFARPQEMLQSCTNSVIFSEQSQSESPINHRNRWSLSPTKKKLSSNLHFNNQTVTNNNNNNNEYDDMQESYDNNDDVEYSNLNETPRLASSSSSSSTAERDLTISEQLNQHKSNIIKSAVKTNTTNPSSSSSSSSSQNDGVNLHYALASGNEDKTKGDDGRGHSQHIDSIQKNNSNNNRSKSTVQSTPPPPPPNLPYPKLPNKAKIPAQLT